MEKNTLIIIFIGLFIFIILLTIILLKVFRVVDFYEGKWVNIFSDDFNRDLSKWTIYEGLDSGTHSCAIYSKKQVVINNDNLVLSLSKSDNGGFNSGRIYSSKLLGPYGYYEAKIKIENNSNMVWPSFWLLPEGGNKYGVWPKSAEIDIFETINNNGKNVSTLHCGKVYTDNTAGAGISIGGKKMDFSKFSIYALHWDPSGMTIHIIDGNSTGGPTAANESNKVGFVPASSWKYCSDVVNTPLPAPFNQPMNIVFNLAVGGDWAGQGTSCHCTTDKHGKCIGYGGCKGCIGLNIDAKLIVDWVKVWESY